jgi:hypothetical protein
MVSLRVIEIGKHDVRRACMCAPGRGIRLNYWLVIVLVIAFVGRLIPIILSLLPVHGSGATGLPVMLLTRM